jgi:predicted AlkP superfamily pyrophosphatase or phosphodiesterase
VHSIAGRIRTSRQEKARFSFSRARRNWFALIALLIVSTVCAAQSLPPVLEPNPPNPPNSASQQSKHYVILVSLDGFRYDYAQKFGAKNLLQMAAQGASAPNGMIPSYPSLTFPNHYTLVTGLYPEHHGIVANTFYDPVRKEGYLYKDPKASLDGSWYGGTPLWVLAEQQGMRSASFFWVASEAEIQGKRPSYYLHFDETYPDDKRVEKVLSWLQLPPEQRPHFITLYYSNVDYAGHKHAPDSPEVAQAVAHVDDMIGKLNAGIAALKLPVDVIVVSDHGEAAAVREWTYLDQFADLSNFQIAGDVTTTLLYPDSEAAAEKAYRELNGASNKFKVYRRAQVPARLHYNSNPREGDPIIIAATPAYIRAHEGLMFGDPPNTDPGQHGYDPELMPEMKAIFYAAGPDIRSNVAVPSFENVDVYPLIARILGLRTGEIDGKLQVLRGILKENSQN